MRKNLFLLVVLASCFLCNGCLNFILNINRIPIPDVVEGVWKIDDETYEVRKKDDYWANVKVFKEDGKDEILGMTFHKVNESQFACFSGWDEEGEKRGFVLPLEIVGNTTVHLYKFEMDFRLNASFSEMPQDQKEKLFQSYLKSGTLKIDKSQKSTVVLEKAYSLDDDED